DISRIPFVLAFSQYSLLFYGKRNYFLALGRTTAVIFFLAIIALDKKEVAFIIGAICMGVAEIAALVAGSNHIIGDALPEPFIKNEILPYKLAGQSFLPDLVGVFDDAPLQ